MNFFLQYIVWMWIGVKISSMSQLVLPFGLVSRPCLEPSHKRAQNARSQRIASGGKSRKQYSTEPYIALYHALCRSLQYGKIMHFTGSLERGGVELMLRRKHLGRGHAAWDLRRRPILHLASNYIRMAMRIKSNDYMTPQRRFTNGTRS